MQVSFDTDEFDTCLRQFKQPNLAGAPIQVCARARRVDEWPYSEAFKVRIITARTKLKLMRDRSDALRESLQRFRMQQHGANRA